MTAPSATARAALAALLLAGPALAGLAGVPLPATSSAWAADSARYVEGMGDVPVMPGLAPAEEAPLVFDKPAGRIAQSVMAGAMDRNAVLSFYNQTMPQLGWSRTAQRAGGGASFLREGEELRLEFVEPAPATAARATARKAAATVVRFSLIPR
ncbi:hypothetical protein TSH58p_11530 [Azospirillum sp. TSH58]|uniref:hypothetical protein n=1 Tax=Azospirillum sp. TSH58 TaxID=664962 RepID=UPI000D5FFDC2|nr:hypothetical protein [Azospirillum sp. TSH58]AWJ84095.1 hypothetical protein TSH58p_11530 [Azospirillum sp. TSH58]PWC71926.1 hypothetical protein TSH58_09235 [Azospirillum sp. TSH58]